MSLPLHQVACAALAHRAQGEDEVARWLRAQFNAELTPAAAWAAWQAQPPPGDRLLQGLALALGLTPIETLAVALACAADLHPMVARSLAWLQAPVGGAHPTVGLMSAVLEGLGLAPRLADLVQGAAMGCGLLQGGHGGALADARNDGRPLADQPLRVPLPLVLALHEGHAAWPGVRLGAPVGTASALPASLQQGAQAQAKALHGQAMALVLRSPQPKEAQEAAGAVAQALQRRAAYFEHAPEAGVGVWLGLTGALPVHVAELAPGETRALPALPGYRGPVLVAAGLEGSFTLEGDAAASWVLPLPSAQERSALWCGHVPAALAGELGLAFRVSAARIHQWGQAAQAHARRAGRHEVQAMDASAATRAALGADLGQLAEYLGEPVGDDALVLAPALRAALQALVQRCRLREGLADGLGPAARSRYRPGVRALFVGPSGTGKTTAVAWLATTLGRPLYRVDLAALTSKYIGETEKNLARLFARAEHAEVVLLFDEADALFGKRTEVRDSNDRHANQETNYLLQRIETFEGIAVLTSNSRTRFDPAFTRRLDAILDFPAPGPQERHALWLAHLGEGHALAPLALNRLAAACDLAGGQVRNAVLAAAAQARAEQLPLGWPQLVRAVAAEYTKLGRPVPVALQGEANERAEA